MNETKVIKSKIESLVDKKWKEKEFVVIVTSEGEISCWSPELSSLLRAAKNSGEEVEIGLTKTAKGNWAVTSVGGTTAPTKGRGGANNANIEKNIVRKENSIVEAAIRRDAVIFTSICHEGFGGDKQTDVVKKAHEYWLEYFRNMYLG